MRALIWVNITVSLFCCACGNGDTAGSDAQVDSPAADSRLDSPALDALTDRSGDVRVDQSLDSTADVAVDVAADQSVDSSVDATLDATLDVAADQNSDSAVDACTRANYSLASYRLNCAPPNENICGAPHECTTMFGIVAQYRCYVPCESDCDCHPEQNCMPVTDKSGTRHFCLTLVNQ